MELISASVSSPEPVRLISHRNDMFVENENAAYRVERHNINPLLKEVMQRKAMGEFTEKGQGYIRVKQLSDGEYALEAKVRGDGGGWWTGELAYWGTKVICYGTMAFVAKKAIENSPIMRDLKHTPVGNGLNQAGYALSRPLVTNNTAGFATAGVVGFLEKTDDATQDKLKETVAGSVIVFGGGKVIAGVEAAANTARVIGYSIWWLP